MMSILLTILLYLFLFLIFFTFILKSPHIREQLVTIWFHSANKIERNKKKELYSLTLSWIEAIYEKSGRFSIVKFIGLIFLVNTMFLVGFYQSTNDIEKSILADEESCVVDNEKDYERCLEKPEEYSIKMVYPGKLCAVYKYDTICADDMLKNDLATDDSDLEKLCKRVSTYSWNCYPQINGHTMDDSFFLFIGACIFIWAAFFFDYISYRITKYFYIKAVDNYKWGGTLILVDLLLLIVVLYIIPLVLITSMGHSDPEHRANLNLSFLFLAPVGPFLFMKDNPTVYQTLLMLPAALSVSLSTSLIMFTYIIVKVPFILRFMNYIIEVTDQLDAKKWNRLILKIFTFISTILAFIAFIMYLKDKGL